MSLPGICLEMDQTNVGATVDITAANAEVTNCNSSDSTALVARPWITTWLRMRPLSGLVAIVLIVCCMLANLGILFGSNHAPT